MERRVRAQRAARTLRGVQPAQLDIGLLSDQFAVVRLDPSDPLPSWAQSQVLSSVTRTGDELSVLCPQAQVPAGVRREDGFRALVVRGPLDFSAVGILVAIAQPLAQAGIAILAISTFDTDYVLVREADLPLTEQTLTGAGHRISATPATAIG